MPKVTGKYQRLRKRLRERDIDQAYLAELLGRSPSYVSSCLLAKSYWQIDEVYKIAQVCDIPPNEIYRFFPADGIDTDDGKPDQVQIFADGMARMIAEYISASKSGGAA